MSESAISIRQLTKDFALGLRGVKLRAVDKLSLEVGENQIYGLLGPNGSGKSTTIKIILGLLRSSSGTCEIFGRPSEAVEARRSVGFLPEAPYFYRFLSGRELVRHYARLCLVPRAEIDRAVDEVIRLVGMEEAAHRRVGTYSKGMLQRIGLAQAIVHDPGLVILDEPTAGVDPLGSAAIADIIKELKRRGKTILVSSHLLAQIEGLCDRVAILHRGQLVREGRVDALIEHQSADSFVARGLDAHGHAMVKKAIEAQGGELLRVEKPRLSLDALFLKEVQARESAREARNNDRESRP
jgi:ABC-2 type transport system ATP-binding protein